MSVQCRLCGKWLGRITPTHLAKEHQITSEEYRRQFPDAPMVGHWEVIEAGGLNPRSSGFTGIPPDVLDQVVSALEEGVHLSVACRLAGIYPGILYRTISLADAEEDPEGPYHQVADRLQRAVATSELLMVRRVVSASSEDWRAASWWLEHARPERWGARSEVLLSGEVDLQDPRQSLSDEDLANRVQALLQTVAERVGGGGPSSPPLGVSEPSH